MDTKTAVIMALYLSFLTACDCNNVDAFGLNPVIEVPIRSFPVQSSFTIGDTLWWEADFSNQVAVRDVEQRMDLRDFDFFSTFYIQSIEGAEVSPSSSFEVTPIVGDIMFSVSDESLIYEITPVKDVETCSFKFGVVLKEPGIYVAGISTLELIYDFYEHPALYACGRRRRETFVTNYDNSSSSREAFETLYEPFGNPDLVTPITYERYAAVGSISFIVTE